MMRELNEKEKEIMDALLNCDFNDLFNDECNDDDCFCYNVYEPFKEKYKGEVSYATGATKGVLIFPDLNFVIKIPFKYGDEHNSYDECDDNYYSDMYCGADCPNGWDYCEVETIKYENAEEYDVQDCFAKTELLGTIKDYPIYKQELATIYTNADSSTSSHTKEDEEKVEKYCDQHRYDCFNTDWLSDAYVYFGEEKFYNLMAYIQDYNIEDLHSHNIGYIGMRPVLVDYSSFNN